MSGIIGGAGSRSGIVGITDLDYEEGTWTPSISIETSESVTENTMFGRYTKIGNLVNVWYSCNFDKASGSNNFTITGLPFISENVSGLYALGTIALSNYNRNFEDAQVYAIISPNKSFIFLVEMTQNGSAQTGNTAGSIANTTGIDIYGSLTYRT